uniref:Uncharacterized protein n=1 Tax=Timema genevievae TaxID=629358 RepID=A0A7R9PQQ8_TIMGE|nr:unnamed protein product [Timema genevievae]
MKTKNSVHTLQCCYWTERNTVHTLHTHTENLPVTRIVDELMEMKTSQETEDYRYFDPKQLRTSEGSQPPRTRTPFQEAIVFIVGGGNYIEYQNLADYTKVTKQPPPPLS